MLSNVQSARGFLRGHHGWRWLQGLLSCALLTVCLFSSSCPHDPPPPSTTTTTHWVDPYGRTWTITTGWDRNTGTLTMTATNDSGATDHVELTFYDSSGTQIGSTQIGTGSTISGTWPDNAVAANFAFETGSHGGDCWVHPQ